MLNPDDRFFALSGSIYPGGPSTWHIMDWDQRRLVSVTLDEELESADPAIDHLGKHMDELAPDVFEIRVSPQGDLISVSTDREDDNMFCPFYPPLEAAERPDGIQVISRPELEELDRLGPLVDLVRCVKSAESSKKVSIAMRRLPYAVPNVCVVGIQVLLRISTAFLRMARNELVDAFTEESSHCPI